MSTAALGDPASAKLIDRESIHEETSEVVTNFCDSAGLTVRVDNTAELRFMINTRGRDGVPYYAEHVRFTQVVTNLATGDFVRIEESSLSKDQVITDNGDGTFTITVLATGASTLYDSSGAPIARNPGQVRFQLLVDNGGTPSDPSDDEELEFLGVIKGSTGRSDDYCAATIAAIG